MDRSETLPRAIIYGDARIEFTIRFVDSSASRVRISLLADGQVLAQAPHGTDPEAVMQAVRKRARWIWQQLEAWHARRNHVVAREYVSGESHFYLGRRHLLKVHGDGSLKPGVKMLRGRLEVSTRDTGPRTVKLLLESWYRQRAKVVFARRLAACIEQAPWLAEVPTMRLLNMKTQWGSCSAAGELILNPALVKAPTVCIDYVLVHELCHIQEHNHSPRFYRKLRSVLHDWEARKRELDEMAELILGCETVVGASIQRPSKSE